MLDREEYKRNLDENLVDDEEKLSPLFKVGIILLIAQEQKNSLYLLLILFFKIKKSNVCKLK